MPSNFTENYQLSQWEPEDAVVRVDFNTDNAKIDAALKAEADARLALAGTISARNCAVYTTSYTGNGPQEALGSRTLTFPRKPMMLLIYGSGRMFFSFRGAGVLWSFYTTDGLGSVSWEENSVTLSGYGERGGNYPGVSYRLFALLEV